ncbi:MAG: GNAT family N-acetyltransferase [Chlorobia bacterium]|nr:GNAT family N-acetyltransferase [Fimbriimonadaceae bacterium]
MIDVRPGIENTDFDRVHPWLASSYWSPGIARDRVERAAENSSLVINAFLDAKQVGYCRVVSDRTTFAYLCDVFVDDDARGQGVAQAMVELALAHPEHQNLRRWLLATHDAHSLYAKFGFELLPNPERWMIIRQAVV